METTRQKKISRLLQRELSEIFIKEARQLVAGTMVSVSKASVTSDLTMARFYISIFPSERKEDVLEKLNSSIGLVRRFLGLRVGKQLRIIPELQFFIDDSLDYIDNIDRLLKE